MDTAALAPVLDQARQRELWVQEALATAAIEGEQLNLESLRTPVDLGVAT